MPRQTAQERRKEEARWMLARLIPIDEWLTMKPRLPGDIAQYRAIEGALHERVRTGRGTPRVTGFGSDMPVSVECLDDESTFFRFDDESATHR